MSWIQENKFTAGLAGVTLVGSVALLYLAGAKGTAYEETTAQLQSVLKTEAELQSRNPFPNEQNLQDKLENISAFGVGARKLQAQFLEYRPESLTDFKSGTFSELLSAYRSTLMSAFGDGTELPQGTYFGFEEYASRLPKATATGELKYQLEASEWLFSQLAEVGPEALINVHRPLLAVETGEKTADAPKVKRKSKKSKKSKKMAIAQPVFTVMPIEITFRASEAQLSTFVQGIANSDKYCYDLRSVRVQNERQLPPNEKDAKFEEKEDSGFDEGGGEFILGGDPAEAEVAESSADSDETRLLMPVLGDEKLNVHMQLNLVIFKSAQEVEIDVQNVGKSIRESRANTKTESNE